MTFRIYLMPMIEKAVPTGPLPGDVRYVRAPKYEPAGPSWAIDLGEAGQDECLLGAYTTTEEHLAAQNATDVLCIPEDLDNAVGGAKNVVQQELETRNMPSDWVTPATLWRDVVRRVAALALFLQRISGIMGRSTGSIPKLFAGNTLDNPVPVAFRAPAMQAAVELGIDTTGITATSTVREVFARVTSEDRGATVNFMGIEI